MRLSRVAVLVAACTALSAPLAAQAQSAAPAPKSPAAATLMSLFVPGAGQFYSGENGKGAAYLAVDVASTAALVYGLTRPRGGTYNTCEQTDGLDYCTQHHHSSNGEGWTVAGAVVGGVNTILAMIDAHRDANQYNREHGLIAEIKSARPMLGVGARGETRMGLAFALR